MFSKRACITGFIISLQTYATGNLAQISKTLFHFFNVRFIIDIIKDITHPNRLNRFASASLKPRRVIAGEPIRIPDVTNGLRGSFGALIFVHSDISTTQCSISIFTCNILSTKSNKTGGSLCHQILLL